MREKNVELSDLSVWFIHAAILAWPGSYVHDFNHMHENVWMAKNVDLKC
jgi:hypothetical protein